MTKFDAALEHLRELRWPTDQFVIFGSGPLAIRGIRPADDLDVLALPPLWNSLSEQYDVTEHRSGIHHLFVGSIEVLDAWWPEPAPTAAIVAAAELIEGLPFVPLDLVFKWKRLSNRPKDLADCALIQKYCAAHSSRAV